MTEHCSSCDSELVPNAKFCNTCGQAVAAMPQEEAPSPEPPPGDGPGGGIRRWFAGASSRWAAMLVVSVVLVVCLIGVGAWLAVARSGEEEERTPTPSTARPAAAVGATATPQTVTSPATPAPTLPSGRIAFVSERDGNSEIYVMNTDGSGQTNFTKNAAADTDPAWSPDGQRIAWASDRNGNFDIYIADSDGSEATRLTASPVDELSPRWSPDGERIAFSRAGEIMVMNSDGSATSQLTEMEPESTAAPCKAGGFLGGWSPDGTQLTFYAASISQGSGQICIIDADGSDLTVVKADPGTYHVEPAWSPFGRHIAYRSVRQDNHEVYVVNIDGSDDTNLTASPATDIEPAWSPDGRWIAFASNGDGNFEIYIMRSDGSEVIRLTHDAAKDSVPAWGAPRLLAPPGPTAEVPPVDIAELPEQPTVPSLPTPASIPTVQMPTPVSIPTVQMPTPPSSSTIEIPTIVPPAGLSTPEPVAPTPVPGVWLGNDKLVPKRFLIEFEVSADRRTVTLTSMQWMGVGLGCPEPVRLEAPISAAAPIVWGGKYNGFVIQTQHGEVRGWFTSATTAEGAGGLDAGDFETPWGSQPCYLGWIEWSASPQY